MPVWLEPKEGWRFVRSILARFILRMASAAAICFLAGTACGGNDGEKQRATETAPAPSANATVPGEIEAAARKLLADELGVDEGDFRLGGSESVQRSDVSLGCPREGVMYAQVITPGYKLVFDFDGTSYAVHTNSAGSYTVVCRDGQ